MFNFKVLTATIGLCFFLSIVFSLTQLGFAAQYSEMQDMNQLTYQSLSNRIDALGQAKDLKGLEQIAQNVENGWDVNRVDVYAHLMLKIVQTFSSENFQDNSQYDLAQKYAFLALEKLSSDKNMDFPIDVELKLLLHLQEDRPSVGGIIHAGDWAAMRRIKTELWLSGWRRFEKERIHDFDFSNLPQMKVAPPSGTNLPAGVAPEQIKDLKLRAQYEADIEKNNLRIQQYNMQHRLKSLERLFLPKAEKYIVQAYAKPPENLLELEKLLNTYIKDEMAKSKIVEEVRERKAW